MEDNTQVQSSFSATIHAPIETVDIPVWCFGLSESEYQSCSPAHVSAALTTAPDGRRMSINVEVLGGNPMVQHYVEEIARTASPAARLQLGRFYASRQGESRCDLGLEREEDRRQYMRVHQFGAQLLSRRSSWTLWPNRACHGRSSKRLASLFQRRTTGRRRRCSQRASSVMHYDDVQIDRRNHATTHL